jgi:hypothetical protein
MRYTIDLLLRGDPRVVHYYAAARARWLEILATDDARSVEALAARLTGEPFWFEHHCGGRWQGQEIMAFSGIGHLYDPNIGFEASRDVVLRIFDAFMASFCSLEVKWHAERASEAYNLDDLREEEFDE